VLVITASDTDEDLGLRSVLFFLATLQEIGAHVKRAHGLDFWRVFGDSQAFESILRFLGKCGKRGLRSGMCSAFAIVQARDILSCLLFSAMGSFS
jgi:hypothetical protein